MTANPHHPNRKHPVNRFRTLGTTLAVALPLLVLTVAPASPAAAHSALQDQNPGDGESVATAPAAISLAFNEDLIDAGTAVFVTDASGRDWAEGTPVVQGQQLEQPLPTEMPAGSYDVVWRVVSADGHPIDGAFAFTVTEGVDGPAETTPAEPAPSVTGEPSAEASEPSPAPESETSADEGGISSTVVLIVATLLLLLVVPALVLIIKTARARRE